MTKTSPYNDTAESCMNLIRTGKVRRHILRETGRIHTGTAEHEEYQTYRDFLPSKNCSIVYNLTGRYC